MNKIFGIHPAVCAFLLGAGAFFVLFFGYKCWHPEADISLRKLDSDFTAALYWGLFGLGCLMWLAGGIIFGINRNIHWFVALALHLLPFLGLILMALLRSKPTPREAWAIQNPGVDENEKTARRRYRPMKPLY